MDSDANLIMRASDRARQKDFFEPILLKDSFDDWQLAKEFGAFMVRQYPDETMGHAVLARACRHLGEHEKSRDELEQCRRMAPHAAERDLLQKFLEDEDKAAGTP
jgi:hypothetical protein